MKIGVICPSEIAIRRFMPALQNNNNFEFAGVGVFSKEERFGFEDVDDDIFQKALSIEKEKARIFVERYGGCIYDSYTNIILSKEIEAIYIPLPPALHFRWAKFALENGKHVLVEKPSTLKYEDSLELIKLAKKNKLALHENYMFTFHNQLDEIDRIIKSGLIGDVRLFRISFGFPRRSLNDFRYNKELGGGALIDAGGYTIRYATRLLGETAKLKYAQSNFINEFEVDIFGSAAMVNDNGVTAQLSFGMDNDYKCELEVWGSVGTLITGRVLTAPTGFIPEAIIRIGPDTKKIVLPSDDSFLKSIDYFYLCTEDNKVREKNYFDISRQAKYIEDFKKLAGWE